jgi:hypothetical protein
METEAFRVKGCDGIWLFLHNFSGLYVFVKVYEKRKAEKPVAPPATQLVFCF